MLRKLAPLLTSSEQIDRIQMFASKKGLDTSNELKTALDNARYNLKWTKENIEVIKDAIKRIQLNDK